MIILLFCILFLLYFVGIANKPSAMLPQVKRSAFNPIYVAKARSLS